MSDTNADARKVNPVDMTKVKAGDLMQFRYWGEITAVVGDTLSVKNVDNGPATFSVNGSQLVESATSADQYKEEVLLSRTKVARLLSESPNRPLTVAFVKKDGSDRIMRGRLIPTEDSIQGYFKVEDLDIVKTDKEDRLRLVDSRTLKYLIVDGVKYTVK